jgi:hypothetical protein
LFGSRFRIGEFAEMLAHLFRCGKINRARMRFFLSDAGIGQIVDDDFCLHLELACQLVDSDLIRVGH